jgi:hypothetical protein
MNGTVTITLKDFEELKESSKAATELKNNLTYAAKELEVFLSYLCTRENITPFINEFNAQNQTQILIIDGRAKIKFRNQD